MRSGRFADGKSRVTSETKSAARREFGAELDKIERQNPHPSKTAKDGALVAVTCDL